MSPDIIFFLDRNIGKRVVAQALRDHGEQVEIHDDHFIQDEEDEGWIPVVSRKNWIILTKDERIAYRNLQKLIVLKSRARVFVLVSKGITGQSMADTFVKALPSMKRIVAEEQGPFIAKVYSDGSARIWKNEAALSQQLSR